MSIDKLKEYSLYLVAFLLPWQARWIIRPGQINGGYNEYLTISLYAVDVILLILLATFSITEYKRFKKSAEKEKDLKINLIWWLIAGLELTIFISLFLAEDLLLAVYKYAVFLLGVGLFWLLQRLDFSRFKLLSVFLFSLSIQAGLAVFQFLNQYAPSFKWLGLAEHDPQELGVSVVEAIGPGGIGERWLRAYGGMDHPNILGGTLVVGLLFLFFLFLKNGKNLVGKTGSYFLMVFGAVLTSGVILSFSRNAWLSLGLSLLVILIGLFIAKNKFGVKRFFELALVSVFVFIIFFISYQNIFLARFDLDNRLESKSYNERVDSMEKSSEIIQDNPLGVGIGNYALALEEEIGDKKAWNYQPVHNTYLLILSELGFAGLIFFLGVIVYFGVRLIKREDYIKFAILTSIVVMMLFDHWWWSLHFGVLFFWFVLGVIHGDMEKTKNIKN